MTTEQEIQIKIPHKTTEKTPAKKAGGKPAAKRGNTRRKNIPRPKPYDHIPIIIALLVIFSLTLICIGIGLTRYLTPERAGIPACGRMPCSPPFSASLSQKGGGE